MIKQGIPIYILPEEKICRMCKHFNVEIKLFPCSKCQDLKENCLPHWEISPERKIITEITNQRIEHLEFTVLELKENIFNLKAILDKHKFWDHDN